jgi:hypothetical protein
MGTNSSMGTLKNGTLVMEHGAESFVVNLSNPSGFFTYRQV